MVVEAVLVALLLDDEEENECIKAKKTCVRSCIKNKQEFGAFCMLRKNWSFTYRLWGIIDGRQNAVQNIITQTIKTYLEARYKLIDCIKPTEICNLTLHSLASGKSFWSLEFQFKIGRKTISLVMDVTTAIDNKLSCYLVTPKTKNKWLSNSQKFQAQWNFPNGLRAIDGKDFVLKQPFHSGLYFRFIKGQTILLSWDW